MKKIFKKNLFNKNKVNEIRNYLKNFEKNNQGDPHVFSIESITQNTFLWNFIFNKSVLEFIKKSFNEEIYFYNNIVIQKNNLRFDKRLWYHKDSGASHQSEILKKKENELSKVGFYLQKNIKGKGGGIDILKPFKYDNFSENNRFINKFRGLYYKMQNTFTDTHVYSEAGDVIIFNALINHRTSLTEEKYKGFTEDKYAVYLQFVNYNLIKDTLKIIDKEKCYKNDADIEKQMITYNSSNLKFKVLNKDFTNFVSQYLGA
jgi:hypothetical protein